MSKEDDIENARDSALRLSVEEETRRKTNSDQTHERSIIIIGSKNTGKSTMVNKFLEKDDTPKPTIAMDYSFGRKVGKNLVKNIVHVWDVGHLASSLLSAAMRGSTLTHSPHHTTLLIVLDLSKPDILFSSFEEILSVARSALKMSYDMATITSLNEKRLIDKNKDFNTAIDSFPLKTCIIGGRYDEFKEFDLDKKQLIGKVLRAVAYSLGAGLCYSSNKDKVLTKRMKDLLSFYGFASHPIESKCTDYEKPLIIPAGMDSLAQIGLETHQFRPTNFLDSIKQIYISQLPQKSNEENNKNFEDPSNDPNFNEPMIDRLKAQKEEEIGVLLQDMLEGRTAKILIPGPL